LLAKQYWSKDTLRKCFTITEKTGREVLILVQSTEESPI